MGGKQGRSLSVLQLELPRLREGECLEHGLLPPRLCTQAEAGRPDPGLLRPPPPISPLPPAGGWPRGQQEAMNLVPL